LQFLWRASPGTDQTSARTNALMSRPETSKMTASVISVAAGSHPAMLRDNAFLGTRFKARNGSRKPETACLPPAPILRKINVWTIYFFNSGQ
jgi:hypothetical protein